MSECRTCKATCTQKKMYACFHRIPSSHPPPPQKKKNIYIYVCLYQCMSVFVRLFVSACLSICLYYSLTIFLYPFFFILLSLFTPSFFLSPLFSFLRTFYLPNSQHPYLTSRMISWLYQPLSYSLYIFRTLNTSSGASFSLSLLS